MLKGIKAMYTLQIHILIKKIMVHGMFFQISSLQNDSFSLAQTSFNNCSVTVPETRFCANGKRLQDPKNTNFKLLSAPLFLCSLQTNKHLHKMPQKYSLLPSSDEATEHIVKRFSVKIHIWLRFENASQNRVSLCRLGSFTAQGTRPDSHPHHPQESDGK